MFYFTGEYKGKRVTVGGSEWAVRPSESTVRTLYRISGRRPLSVSEHPLVLTSRESEDLRVGKRRVCLP